MTARPEKTWPTIGILAVTQIASWGSIYYAFSLLAPAMQKGLGLSAGLTYGAFSWSILVAGLAATPVGIAIDRFGGRRVMAAGSMASGGGLLWLAYCQGPAGYLGAWTLLGLGMALGLYEAAFATINRKVGEGARGAISTLTLFAGFASTVFWPLTAQLDAQLGWRDTYLCFAALQLLCCLPLHLALGQETRATAARAQQGHTLGQALGQRAFWLLAIAFSINALVFSALSVHLIPLLVSQGHSVQLAVLLAALIGPVQVIGRVLERTWGARAAPQTIGKLAFAGLPAALLALILCGQKAWAIALFCVLYGLSNGVMTILRGTIPQALFGREHYGAIAGAMAGPALLCKAAGPLAAALVLSTQAPAGHLLWGFLLLGVCAYAVFLGATGQGQRSASGADAGKASSGKSCSSR